MKFNVKDVYTKIYGQFRSDEDMTKFLVEKNMTYLYVSRTYSDGSMLYESLTKRGVDNEHDAYVILSDDMKSYELDLTVEELNKDEISKGRRLFTSACSRLVHVHNLQLYDVVFETYPTIDKVYILYDKDKSIRCIYVDEDIVPTERMTNVSKFPDGYKELLSDKLVVVKREV